MRNKFKRYFAFLLTFVMLFTIFPSSSFATEINDTSVQNVTEETTSENSTSESSETTEDETTTETTEEPVSTEEVTEEPDEGTTEDPSKEDEEEIELEFDEDDISSMAVSKGDSLDLPVNGYTRKVIAVWNSGKHANTYYTKDSKGNVKSQNMYNKLSSTSKWTELKKTTYSQKQCAQFTAEAITAAGLPGGKNSSGDYIIECNNLKSSLLSSSNKYTSKKGKGWKQVVKPTFKSTVTDKDGWTKQCVSSSAGQSHKQFMNMLQKGTIKAGDIILFAKAGAGYDSYGHAAIITPYIVEDTATNGQTGVLFHASGAQGNNTTGKNGMGMLSWSLKSNGYPITVASVNNDTASVSEDDIDDYISEMAGGGVGFTVLRYVTDEPADNKGYITIQKNPDSVQLANDSSLDYSMIGITYTVYSDKECKNEIGDLVIDEESSGIGYCTDPLQINLGTATSKTVYLKETDNLGGDTGFAMDPTVYTATVTKDSTDEKPVNISVKENTIVKGLNIHKQTDPACARNVAGNPMYSLKGAEYAIYYEGTNFRAPYAASETALKAGTTSTANLVTDENGNTPTVYMGFGTYDVREIKASPGYVLDSCSTGTPHKADLTSGSPAVVTITCNEPVKVDPVPMNITKKSSEASTDASKSSTAGAVFEVDYYNGNYTLENLPAVPTARYYMATYIDEKGVVKSADLRQKVSVNTAASLGFQSDNLYSGINGDGLPQGTFTIKEVKAPDGYDTDSVMTLNGKPYTGERIIAHISVDASGNASSDLGNATQTIEIINEDSPLRADVKFTKVRYDDQKPLAGIPFKITNKATGESHIVVTDEKGVVDTSAIPHSSKTNAYDKTYDKTVELPGNTDTGTWFFGNADTNKQAAEDIDDKEGAFPVGTATPDSNIYILEELPCPKNRNRLQLIRPIEFSLTAGENSTTFDLGTISNVGKIQLSSLAISDETGSHVIYPDETVNITDTVSYTFLTAGETYTLKGILMEIHEDGKGLKSVQPALDDEGHYIRANRTFTVEDKYEVSPQEKSGSEKVKFSFKGRNLDGRSYVVYEYLFKGADDELIGVVTKKEDGREVFSEIDTSGILLDSAEGEEAKHADMNDPDQTLFSPHMETDAWAAETGAGTVMAKPDMELTDTVTYISLIPDRKYRLVASVMAEETKDGECVVSAVKDTEGREVKAEKIFTPASADGTVDVVLPKFDATQFQGKKVVIYEQLYDGDTLIISHESFDDERQTVYFPELQTEALDSETLDHNSFADKEVTIIDKVSYKGLIPGREYIISGKLMNQATGEPLKDATGNEITGSTVITPEAHEGVAEVKFTFDGSCLAGQTAVVFEDLLYNKIKIATHSDITDKKQTIWFPEIKTSLRDEKTGIKNTCLDGEVTLIDTVSYKNLISGYKYKVSGYLMDKTVNAPILIDGKKIEAYTIFTAGTDLKPAADGTEETADNPETGKPEEEQTVVSGTVDVTYKFDGTKTDLLKGDGSAAFIVCFETLTVAQDYTEQGHYETVHKDAYDEKTYETIVTCDKCQEELSKLPDEEFKKHVAEHGTYTEDLVEGDPIHHEAEDVQEYVKDADAMTKDVIIAVHEDINDVDQTVAVPAGHTSARDSETKKNVAFPGEKVTIIDTVYFSGLQAGQEYSITGTLYKKPEKVDKNTVPEPLTVNGKNVTSTLTFTPSAENGSIDMTFTFDASALAGESIVVFEDCYHNSIKVFTHSDLTDENQTIHFPKIGTTAKDSKGRKILSSMDTTLIDTISYTNLKPGVKYIAYGRVMDPTTKKTAESGSKEITAKAEFTPKTADGTVDVTFKFNLKGLENRKLVVFEDVRVKATDVSIGIHEDWDDKDQTVSVTDQPKTGGSMAVLIFTIITLLAAVGAGAVIYRKRKLSFEE